MINKSKTDLLFFVDESTNDVYDVTPIFKINLDSQSKYEGKDKLRVVEVTKIVEVKTEISKN